MPPDPRKYIWDARRAAVLIGEFVADTDLVTYRGDQMLKSAVERQFEIIGEALNRLSRVDADLAARVPDLRRLVAFRNILIHGYASVDDAIVWDAATNRLPTLTAVLAALLDD
jgi:uncharacterized protein with HEPN domain